MLVSLSKIQKPKIEIDLGKGDGKLDESEVTIGWSGGDIDLYRQNWGTSMAQSVEYPSNS